MLLAELLRKYENTAVVVSDGMRQWDIRAALALSYPRGIDDLDLDQEITYVQEGNRVLVWILPQFNAEPAYVLTNVPKKPGRPAGGKAHVGFTVDEEVAARVRALAQGKASHLANRLLRQHFGLPDRNKD
jgi:hypothetical protein